jgi:DNA-binding NarL/FixJ family response regulator
MPQIESVDNADNLLSALEAIEEHPPAMVLLDAGLLEDDGQSAFQRMDSTCPGMRRVVLVASESQRQRALMAGADTALVRGITARTLHHCLAGLLSGSKFEGGVCS